MFSMTMLMLFLPMVMSTLVQDCMKKCEDLMEDKETVRCTSSECLMRSKGYNWREVPRGDTWLTNRKDAKDLTIPCCPGGGEDLASAKVCEGYREFERQLNGTPVRVWLDFKILKIYNISMAEDHYSAVMWLEMSWVDPRLYVCPCPGKEKEERVLQLAGDHKQKLWLPDLHIWEAREFERMWELARDRDKIKVVQIGKKQPMVVYELNFNAVLACHFNTSHFPLARNKCSVRFGSYTQDKTKVVFEQNSNYISTQIKHPQFSFQMFPLYEKAKEVSRDQPKKKSEHNTHNTKIVMAYDGFQIIVNEELGTVEIQYFVSMWVLVSLAVLGIFLLSGQPDPIDRAGLFAMALLGSVLLFVQITTNTPHGYESQVNSVVSFLKSSIGIIVTCFACYCILVRLTSDEVITGAMQDKMELVVLIAVLPFYMVWCLVFIWENFHESMKETCHNLVH